MKMHELKDEVLFHLGGNKCEIGENQHTLLDCAILLACRFGELVATIGSRAKSGGNGFPGSLGGDEEPD
jgi:hypothetical protein